MVRCLLRCIGFMLHIHILTILYISVSCYGAILSNIKCIGIHFSTIFKRI